MRRYSSRAFTLIEMMVAIAVMGFAGLGVWAFVEGSNRSWDSIRQESEMMNNLRRASRDIGDYLVQSSASVITVNNSGPDWDWIEFQIPIQLSQAGPVWGADGNAGWVYRYEVKNADGMNNLYRITYNGGVEQSRVMLLRDVDSKQGANKGISFSIDTSSGPAKVTTTVRAKRRMHKHGQLKRSLSMVAILKN